MKILYGVQGTGNGHITRARMMADAFADLPVKVDYVFSGKDSEYFNMEPFGSYREFPGLSFVSKGGKISYLQTLKRNHISRFIHDLKTINATNYDLVLNDFQPITAWAARIHKVSCIGLSHQNAFRYKVPVRGYNPVAALVLKWFAPSDIHLGFHWHHFNQPILPPMIKTDLKIRSIIHRKILVYLPFLEHDHFHPIFKLFPDYDFIQYHPVSKSSRIENVFCHPLSQESSMRDFSDCSGLICSTGFGACSEAIDYGKKLLVLPLNGQMEQLSNAAALEKLGCGTVVNKTIDTTTMDRWLNAASPDRISYTEAAIAVAGWIVNGSDLL